MLIGGGPWRDGSGELLVCEAPDRAGLFRILDRDPGTRSEVVTLANVREWDVVRGVSLPDRRRCTAGAGPADRRGSTGTTRTGGTARTGGSARTAGSTGTTGNTGNTGNTGPAGTIGSAGTTSSTGTARTTAAAATTEELTPHEERIAAMMVDGMTNRRIAETLSVSTRAVELRITRIYLKLAIRRRAQLAPALSRRQNAEQPPRWAARTDPNSQGCGFP